MSGLRSSIPDYSGVLVNLTPYDKSNSVSVLDLSSSVIAKVGPVILLHPVQEKVVTALRERLSGLTTVIRGNAYSTEDVTEHVVHAIRIHRSGEPHVCRNFIVALLMMRKLHQEHMWAGNNSKGHIWVDDIRKGRGMPEEFSDAVPVVLSMLLQHGVVVQKVSRNSRKYALNPDRRLEIYEILRERRFAGPRLKQLDDALHRDRQVASVRALDALICYTTGPHRFDGRDHP